ncbi:alginate lyase family protein [Cytophagaceae bacterium YF14B1]|uniref:Alginate lyase family protein n=1 Tax=Xanthocytophaga flava TaxID=3048013 RepID=A0AAE3QUJ9_9BACT|nr:alginate lyase family protein [Xanthocytophaga flavus]MDJ1483520.1 alginate lyase family protein [Xanthocytophaga flavus]
MKKLILLSKLIHQMGWRAFLFRVSYEVKKRSGWLQRTFPTNVPFTAFTTLEGWQGQPVHFFFPSREALTQIKNDSVLDENTLESLSVENELINTGHIPFFNASFQYLGKDYNWLTHPETKYQYSPIQHWSTIRELDPKIGDIKFVWEKSRFAYLYPVIRYDFHTQTDRAAFVFHEIEDWIEKNPLNCGPNYVCSQETSLRILNWTFALHYYKNSPELTEDRFQTIIHSIYWQAQHVAANINFSRIAVRNNHAITECLGLYLVGLLYPFFPESAEWKKNGKQWLTEEGLYQIYEDGSYLQFSMNYHRVTMQLFTWAFIMAERNGDRFEDKLYDRVYKSLNLLYQHQDNVTGHLPNYGANDGALFFRLNSCTYRDYRPQLNALYYFFHQKPLYTNGIWNEDVFWYGLQVQRKQTFSFPAFPKDQSFASPLVLDKNSGRQTGFFVLRDPDKFVSVRCGNHPDRPSQADNLHVDIWYKGINLMRDAGSYKYNTEPGLLKYFMGTASHNTIQLGDQDQMLKGGRFIWYYWSQSAGATLTDQGDRIVFEGKVHVYQQVHSKIFHHRKIVQYKNELRWEIEDTLLLPEEIQQKNRPVYQRWHPHPDFEAQGWKIASEDKNGNSIVLQTKDGWYSSFYGVKEPITEWYYENKEGYFKTTIFCAKS